MLMSFIIGCVDRDVSVISFGICRLFLLFPTIVFGFVVMDLSPFIACESYIRFSSQIISITPS